LSDIGSKNTNKKDHRKNNAWKIMYIEEERKKEQKPNAHTYAQKKSRLS